MEDDFDEFGNFIGKEYSDSDVESEVESAEEETFSNVKYVSAPQETQSRDVPLVKRRVEQDIVTFVPNNWEFHRQILQSAPTLIRNIAVCGHLSHGKTSLCAMIAGIPELPVNSRGTMTKQIQCYSVLAKDNIDKSYALNIVDTPAHPDFEFEKKIGINLCDSICFVVDVVEGLIPDYHVDPDDVSVVVINKLDRLILELRLNPEVASNRIKLVFNDIKKRYPKASIVFASTKYKFSFTINTITSLYEKYQGVKLNLTVDDSQLFCDFILRPIYKLFACALLGKKTGENLFESTGISLTASEWKKDSNERISMIMHRYLEYPLLPLVNEIIHSSPTKSINEEPKIEPSRVVKFMKIAGRDFALMTGPYGGPEAFILFGNSLAKTDKIGKRTWCLVQKTREHIHLQFTIKLPPPVVQVGIQPVHDKPQNYDSIRTVIDEIKLMYPWLIIVESKTGEFTLKGSGELFLDEVINELTNRLSFEIRVSQLLPIFNETVSEESSIAFPTKSSDGSYTVVVTAKPVTDNNSNDELETYSLSHFNDCELLCVNTIKLDEEQKAYLVDGFQLCCKNGPLISSPLKGVQFTISELDILTEPSYELTEIMQRACISCFLVSSPRLMEPWLNVYTIGKVVAGKALYREMEKRGGLILKDTPIYGTNLYYTCGEIAAIDSFGLGIDVITQLESRDTGSFSTAFNGTYKLVSGDPLDSTQPKLRLKAAAAPGKARDYMLKIRRRYGLSEEPQLESYVDEDIKMLLF